MQSQSQSGGVFHALPSIIDRYHSDESQSVDAEENPDENQHEETDALEHRGNLIPPEGNRIITMEMPSAAFFASGSAILSEDGAKLLQEILETKLTATDFQDYQITVEGHTDDVPIKTPQFPSNWELSTARAAAVVRYFIEHGVPAQRLRAAGYAEVLPKLPNRDAYNNSVPENQAQNRRVIIKLEKIETTK